MADFNILWTPAGRPTSVSQTVQYRKKGTTPWTTYQVVGPTVNYITVFGLTDNVIYEFRVLNYCSAAGGYIDGNIKEDAVLTCPELVLTSTYNSITVSWNYPMGGSVTKYDLVLYDSSNTILQTIAVTTLTSTMTRTFTGLTPSTLYKIRLIPHVTEVYIKSDCPQSTINTGVMPVCNPVTSVTATLTA